MANQQRILKAETENTSAAFGQALLPAMQALQKIVGGLIGLFGGNVKALTIFIGVIAAGAAAVVTINAAMTAWAAITKVITALTKAQTVAQAALNVVMRLNPIMLVVTALIALGAAFVLAYKHSETFRRIVDAAFDKVKQAAAAAWNWIKAHWPQLLAVISGPFAPAVLIITRNWDKIEDGARAAVSTLKSIWNGFADFLGNLVDRVGHIADRVANAIKAPINAMIGAWNAIGIPRVAITLPRKKILGKWIGGGSFGFGPYPFPDIPRLAAGGIVTSPTAGDDRRGRPRGRHPAQPAARPRRSRSACSSATPSSRGIVRTEVVDQDTRTARTLLAGVH